MIADYPIKVFVGASASEWLPAKVLEFSIKSRTTQSVEFVQLNQSSFIIPSPKHKKNFPRTPFSFQRFLIPKLCDFKGRAIYLDADMLVFKDIESLWSADFNGNDLLITPALNAKLPRQFSVMLLNNEGLNWDIDEILELLNTNRLSYENLMYEMSIVKKIAESLDPHWNSLESYEAGVTGLLHYTNMNSQPWISHTNALGYLWVNELQRAIDAKFLSVEKVKLHIDKGYLRPSLLKELDGTSNRDEKFFYACDKEFTPPFKLVKKGLINRIAHHLMLKISRLSA